MTDPAPHHLVAAQEFAGDRFWSARTGSPPASVTAITLDSSSVKWSG